MSRLSAALTKIATLVMAHKEIIGSDTMTTTAQTLTGAVNELDGDISSLNGKTPTIHVFRHTGTSTNGYTTIPYPTGYDVNSHYVVTAQYVPSAVAIVFSIQRSANHLIVYTRKTDGSVYDGEVTFEVLCLK